MDLIEINPEKAEIVAGFLKGLANPSRLLVLCALSQGEKSVTELMAATGIAQTSMSQHLARLKAEGIVDFRREHRTLHHFISHPAAIEIMAVLYGHFCAGEEMPPGQAKARKAG
ncbi:MAG TPA: metalloregulator ArsR/SmtB family transcription factor [Bosea sp. (in: a-proteobacteria)]